jgi:hypothetical protein
MDQILMMVVAIACLMLATAATAFFIGLALLTSARRSDSLGTTLLELGRPRQPPMPLRHPLGPRSRRRSHQTAR